MLSESLESYSVFSRSSWTSARVRRAFTEHDLGNVLLNVGLLALLGIFQLWEPRHRFIKNLDDPAINYPFEAQTVPVWMLFALAVGLPLAVMGTICQ